MRTLSRVLLVWGLIAAVYCGGLAAWDARVIFKDPKVWNRGVIYSNKLRIHKWHYIISGGLAFFLLVNGLPFKKPSSTSDNNG